MNSFIVDCTYLHYLASPTNSPSPNPQSFLHSSPNIRFTYDIPVCFRTFLVKEGLEEYFDFCNKFSGRKKRAAERAEKTYKSSLLPTVVTRLDSGIYLIIPHTHFDSLTHLRKHTLTLTKRID